MEVESLEAEAVVVLECLRIQIMCILFLFLVVLRRRNDRLRRRNRTRRITYSVLSRIPSQIEHLSGLTYDKEQDCIDLLRLGRNAFGRLCLVLEQRGDLVNSRGVSIPEQVALFLSVLSHHEKVRVVKKSFSRSGRTVSRYFNNVLNAVIRCSSVFVAEPEPVPADCSDDRWKCFKGCLGALDGTLIPVRVPYRDQAKYRSRKGLIHVNVLAVCNREMNFVYVLTGWEGSAADGRVLRDAIHRENGFKVPRGNYYLCDAGYTNGEGFLAPYRGIRYHRSRGYSRPQNAKELFNLKHSKARNIIERSFSVLKGRWAVLRSNSFYPIQTQNKIILACFLLHNFIRGEMSVDPIEAELQEEEEEEEEGDDEADYVDHIETTQEWTMWRDSLANDMYAEWNMHS